jgi:CRP-like cAMP-binding protein
MTKPSGEFRNGLLRALPPKALDGLVPDLELMEFSAGHILYQAGASIDAVYFPESAVASMVRRMADGAGVEVGTIGREGIVGGSVALGARTMVTECVIQVAGSANKLSTPLLLAAIAPHHNNGVTGDNASLFDLLLLYSQALFEQAAQSAACNRLHALEPRTARWLLMMHDRVDGDELHLTQEFLSYMLGVRRAGVTEACGTLMRAGLIRYRHGRITISDRAGLEAAACECFQINVDAYRLLLGSALTNGA